MPTPCEPRIPVLIFDFGNVVAYFDHDITIKRLADRAGLPSDTVRARAQSRAFQDLATQFERGDVGEIAFCEQSTTLLELELDPSEFAAAWADIFTINHSIIPLIEALDARGYRLVLGSNTNAIHSRQFLRQFHSTLRRFHATVLSHEVRCLKPRGSFYAECVEKAGVSAADCVFIDDLSENVAGARAAGLKAVVYRDTATLCAELENLGVRVAFPLDSRSVMAENRVSLNRR